MSRKRIVNMNRTMKEFVFSKLRLDPSEWGLISNTKEQFVIANKETGEEKVIDKTKYSSIRF